MSMLGATRWRAQSILANDVLTGASSKAAAQGHMPAFAKLALKISSCAASIAGMAKSRWQQNEASQLDIYEVRRLRKEMSTAFDDLERHLMTKTETQAAVGNPKAAEAAFQAFGRMGFIALDLTSKAGDLAGNLGKLAAGEGDHKALLLQIPEKAADVRIALHVASEKLRLNTNSTTGARWAEFQTQNPEVFNGKAPQVAPIDMSEITKGLEHSLMASIAA